jgi:hypothetical protein
MSAPKNAHQTGIPASADGAQQRAVLWMPVQVSVPPPLLEALRRRGIQVTLVYSHLLAMAHACAAHVRPERAMGVLVVLVQPERLPLPVATCRALQRYATRARTWVYEEGAKQSLRPVTEQDLALWGQAEPGGTREVGAMREQGWPQLGTGLAKAMRNGAGGPGGVLGVGPGRPRAGLKLSGGGEDGSGAGEVAPSAQALRAQAEGEETLSADELRMLLGRDDLGPDHHTDR